MLKFLPPNVLHEFEDRRSLQSLPMFLQDGREFQQYGSQLIFVSGCDSLCTQFAEFDLLNAHQSLPSQVRLFVISRRRVRYYRKLLV
jgi:hypothetical protein